MTDWYLLSFLIGTVAGIFFGSIIGFFVAREKYYVEPLVKKVRC